MNTIHPTVFAGILSLIIALRLLVAGEMEPVSAMIIGVSLLLIVNGEHLWKASRRLPSLLRGLFAGAFLSLLALLAAKSLDLTSSGTTVSEEKNLTSVLH